MKKINIVIDSRESSPITNNKQHASQKKISASKKDYERLKNEFFNNISHEFRTPINVILGSIQLFETMGDDVFLEPNRNKFKTYQRIMKQNCFRLLRLVNNLIDVTKMESGYLSLSPNNHNIVRLVDDIVNNSTSYAEAKEIHMSFQAEEQEIVTACDADKIQRVILNLISNAIKFTPKNGQIRVSVYRDEKTVYISVKDTGIGISQNELNSIFDRLAPLDNTLTRDHEGSGIGLSLASSIIKLHGGLIRVNSKPSIGSEFTVELPNRVIEGNYPEKQNESELNLSSSEKAKLEFSDLF